MRDFWEQSNESPQRVLHSGTERQKIAGILGVNDLSNLGLYAWNTLTDQVHRDPALKLLMGLPADASPNVSVWKERIRPKDLPNVEETIDRAKRGDGILYVEYRAFGLDGVERWLAECGRVIFDAARRPVCCIGAVFPLTRRVCC